MPELALRRIQAGVEATRGTIVPATKKLYGTFVPDYKRDSRAAEEDRGSFVKNWRLNHKLVETGGSLTADATFEDLPFMANTFLAGGLTATGSAAAGYTWGPITPDQGSDSIKTLTYEVGDESVSWQMPYGVTDQADFTMALDNALVGVYKIIGQNLIAASPVSYTGGLVERQVESVMGYQSKLFVDTTGTTPGTTQVSGRFISAQWGVHNNVARKFFGDGSPYFVRVGRGKRDVHCQIVFELLDLTQWNQFNQNVPQQLVVRAQFIGTGIAGTNLGTTSAALNPGTITSIPVTALPAAIAGGTAISVGGQAFTVTAAGAASAATSIPVFGQAVFTTIPTAQTVLVAKAQNWDFYGAFQTFSISNRDTNVTGVFDLLGVYDVTAAKEMQLTVVNANSTL